MLLKNKIRFVLLTILVLALLAYHVMGYYIEHFYDKPNINLISISTIARITVLTFLMFASLKWHWLLRLTMRKNFIAGKYEGISIEPDNTSRGNHLEKFEIEQSLFEVTITGSSSDKDGIFITNWGGNYIETTHEREYLFLVRMTTDKTEEKGILSLKILKDGSFTGFYQSCNPKMYYISRITGNRI